MGNYYKVSFELQPFTRDAADFLVAFLAEIGFESFEDTKTGTIGYITEDNFNCNEVENILNTFPVDVRIKYSTQLIQQQDWNEEWEKNYFKPLVLADGRCVVHSTFHTDFPESDYEIVIDPKMAFGTGHHATTSMMVSHLFKLNPEGKRVLDMGTGTGILAILSTKLGAKDVTGIEIDKGAYENAIENASINNVDVKFFLGDASLLSSYNNIDIFLANINRNIILADLESYVKTLSSNGVLILSGYYQDDIPLIELALKENGMKIAETVVEEGKWASIKAVKI